MSSISIGTAAFIEARLQPLRTAADAKLAAFCARRRRNAGAFVMRMSGAARALLGRVSRSIDETASVATLARLAEVAPTPELDIGEAMALSGAREDEDPAVVDAHGRIPGILTEKYVRKHYADEL